uniref:Uncharacterized protein n=1 Tax=Anguilla anguilla TaxID=7936 RepID=A0A0E9XX41_ANGAN
MQDISAGHELCSFHSYSIQKAINDEADRVKQPKLPAKKINQRPK